MRGRGAAGAPDDARRRLALPQAAAPLAGRRGALRPRAARGEI